MGQFQVWCDGMRWSGLGQERHIDKAKRVPRVSLPLVADIGNPSFFADFSELAISSASEELEHGRV